MGGCDGPWSQPFFDLWSLVPAIFCPLVPGPRNVCQLVPDLLPSVQSTYIPPPPPPKYPFLICHYVFRLKILLQFKLYRFIKMTPPCKIIQNPSSLCQKLKFFYLLISIQTRMNIQQGRHESQGKTCRVINECCERL